MYSSACRGMLTTSRNANCILDSVVFVLSNMPQLLMLWQWQTWKIATNELANYNATNLCRKSHFCSAHAYTHMSVARENDFWNVATTTAKKRWAVSNRQSTWQWKPLAQQRFRWEDYFVCLKSWQVFCSGLYIITLHKYILCLNPWWLTLLPLIYLRTI